MFNKFRCLEGKCSTKECTSAHPPGMRAQKKLAHLAQGRDISRTQCILCYITNHNLCFTFPIHSTHPAAEALTRAKTTTAKCWCIICAPPAVHPYPVGVKYPGPAHRYSQTLGMLASVKKGHAQYHQK